jgi:hypothetical protein
MRYRIYFKDETQNPAEVDCVTLRMVGNRRLKAYLHEPKNMEDSVHLFYGSDIKRIADDHDRTFFEAD